MFYEGLFQVILNREVESYYIEPEIIAYTNKTKLFEAKLDGYVQTLCDHGQRIDIDSTIKQIEEELEHSNMSCWQLNDKNDLPPYWYYAKKWLVEIEPIEEEIKKIEEEDEDQSRETSTTIVCTK